MNRHKDRLKTTLLFLLFPAIHSITQKKAIIEEMKANWRTAVPVMTTALSESSLNMKQQRNTTRALSCVYL